MSITLFKENGHLTSISLRKFKDGSLHNSELILLSEHICNCEGCANSLADSFEIDELADAPLGFEQEILKEIKKKKVNNTQFMFYSLRVVVAASIALIFVFSSPLKFISKTNIKALEVKPVSLSGVNTLSVSLNNFSQKIINMEVFNNEKRKK